MSGQRKVITEPAPDPAEAEPTTDVDVLAEALAVLRGPGGLVFDPNVWDVRSVARTLLAAMPDGWTLGHPGA